MAELVRIALGGVLVLVGLFALATHFDLLFGVAFLIMGGVLLVFGTLARGGPWSRASNINMQPQMVFQRQMLMHEQTAAMQNANLSQPNSGMPPSFR